MTIATTRLTGRAGLLAAGILAAVLLAPAAPASAAPADPCTQRIVDAAHALDGSRASAVIAAALKLEMLGAMVRIRTFTTVPNGDLDAAIAAEQKRCTSWRASDGEQIPNLLVLALDTKDRKVGLYYGSQWQPALQGQWLRIQTKFMTGPMRVRDYPRALAGGLTETYRLLDAQVNPPPTPSPTASAVTGDPTGGPTSPVLPAVTPSKPASKAPLFGLLGLLLLGGASWGGVVGLKRRRVRQTAREKALGSYGAASEAFVALDTAVSDAKLSVDALKVGVADEDDVTLDAELGATLATADAATADYLALRDSRPETTLRSSSVVAAAQASDEYDAVTTHLTAAGAAVAALQSQLDAIDEDRKALPRLVDEQGALLVRGRAAAQAVAAKGYHISAFTSALDEAEKTLMDADTCVSSTKILRARRLLDDAASRVALTTAAITALPGRHTSLLARVAATKARLDDARAAAATAAGVFTELQSRYDASCSAGVVAPVAALDGQLEAAAGALDAAGTASTLEAQKFDAADAALDESDVTLASVNAVAADVHALADRLALIVSGSADRLADVKRQVTEAAAFVDANAPDVDPEHARSLRALGERLAVVTKASRAPRPHWLTVDADIADVADGVGQHNAAAHAEYARMVALRQRAEQAVASATRAVGEAASYLGVHFIAGRHAAVDLELAQQILADLAPLSDPEKRIADAESAERTALRALNDATNAVAEAHARNLAANRSRIQSGGGGSNVFVVGSGGGGTVSGGSSSSGSGGGGSSSSGSGGGGSSSSGSGGGGSSSSGGGGGGSSSSGSGGGGSSSF